MAGGVIAAMQQCQPKSEVRVIIVTNGDASYTTALFHGSHIITKRHFWSIAEERQQESLAALILLEINKSQVYFWGFPDRGLSQLWLKYWNGHESYCSPTTGYRRAEQAINSPALQYTGINLLRLIQAELMTFKPTTIIFPHSRDAHADHRALANFTILAASLRYPQQVVPQMLAYTTWLGSKLWMTGMQTTKKARTALSRRALRNEWKLFPLSKSVLEQKALALGCYFSQGFSAGKLLRTSSKNPQEIFELVSPLFLDAEIGVH